MIETRRLKNIVIFIQTILNFVLSRKIINWKNKLGFNINKNIKKEFITLQLEEALAPKKIETEDSKMTNISVLTVSKLKKK